VDVLYFWFQSFIKKRAAYCIATFFVFFSVVKILGNVAGY
jgi:hypothetical protein